jgi:hypothetical protein
MIEKILPASIDSMMNGYISQRMATIEQRFHKATQVLHPCVTEAI